MIKGKSTASKSITLGLTDENVKRIKDNQPIQFCLSELGYPVQTMAVCHGNQQMFDALNVPPTHNTPITAKTDNGIVLLILPDDTLSAMESGQPVFLDIEPLELEAHSVHLVHGADENTIARNLGINP
jgi:hypothetical protein